MKNVLRPAVIAAVAATSMMLAGPAAFASDGDLTIIKSHDATGPVGAGDVVNYTVVIENVSDTNTLQNVAVHDGAWGGLSLVAGSLVATVHDYSTATDDFTSDYAGGSGWADASWSEDNDDATSTTGYVLAEVPGPSGDDNVSLHGDGSISDPLDEPGIFRSFDTTGATAASVTFGFASVNAENDDAMGLWVSTDGGTTYSLVDTYVPTDGGTVAAPVDVTEDLSSFLPAANLTIRFGVFANASDGAAGDSASDYLVVDSVTVDVDVVVATDNDDSGSLTPDGIGICEYAELVHVDDGVNLAPGQVLEVTYSAQVDFDLPCGDPGSYEFFFFGPDGTENYAGTLATGPTSESSAFIVYSDDFGSATYFDFEYATGATFLMSAGAAVEVGSDVEATFAVTVDEAGDGSPVCDLDLAADVPGVGIVEAVYDNDPDQSGDTNDDGCLDADETWYFVLTIPGAGLTDATGAFDIDVQVLGADLDDDGVASNDTLTITVVLAATGAQSTSLLWGAGALVLGGATLVLIARRVRNQR